MDVEQIMNGCLMVHAMDWKWVLFDVYCMPVRIALYIIVVPGQPSVSVGTTTATSISLSWSGSVVDSYEVVWRRDISGECDDVGGGSMIISVGFTSYDIMGLEEDSSYTITVTATNTAGSSAVSDAVTAMTLEAGER